MDSSLMTGLIGVGVAIISSAATIVVTKIQSRSSNKKADADAMMQGFATLNDANTKFRDEVRKDLAEAKGRISVLEALILAKDERIKELEQQVYALRSELTVLQASNPHNDFKDIPT